MADQRPRWRGRRGSPGPPRAAGPRTRRRPVRRRGPPGRGRAPPPPAPRCSGPAWPATRRRGRCGRGSRPATVRPPAPAAGPARRAAGRRRPRRASSRTSRAAAAPACAASRRIGPCLECAPRRTGRGRADGGAPDDARGCRPGRPAACDVGVWTACWSAGSRTPAAPYAPSSDRRDSPRRPVERANGVIGAGNAAVGLRLPVGGAPAGPDQAKAMPRNRPAAYRISATPTFCSTGISARPPAPARTTLVAGHAVAR